MDNVTQKARRYNPNQIRRRVRHVETTPDGQAMYKIKSLTRDDGTEWNPVVDLMTGSAHCDCPDFEFKRRHAHINQPDSLCKHLKREVADLERKGELMALGARLEAERKAREAQRSVRDEELMEFLRL